MRLLDEDGQCRRAAAQVKHTLARPNLCLIDQAALERLFAHDPAQQRIVERREAVEPQRRDVSVILLHVNCLPVTPISLGTFFGSEIGKYPAIDLSDCEFILHLDRAGILANPCNPWEIRVSAGAQSCEYLTM